MMNQAELLKNVHSIMGKDPYLIELFKGSGESLDKLEGLMNDVFKQMNVDTSTWGLDLFERELGINQKDKPNEERRAGIKAKWRSSGKSDIYLIQQICDSWKNGQVSVEFRDDGLIHITFDGEYGVPSNLEGLEAAIDEVKPAHIGWTYHFKYLLIKDIHNTMKLTDLENQKINAFAFNTGGKLNGEN